MNEFSVLAAKVDMKNFRDMKRNVKYTNNRMEYINTI